MLINAAEGSYVPSYFYMFIDTEDTTQIIDRNPSTFAHEYIHFLQDLILPYCIRNNLANLNSFAYVHALIRQEKKLVRPFDRWGEDQKIVNKQFQYTWGCRHFENYIGSICDIDSQYFEISTAAKVYKYELIFKNLRYQVGARDFLEYIAHKIEYKHFAEDNVPELPYKTVDKIFEYYGLECIPEQVRICIIEYCLYNDNPIRMLLEIFMQRNYIKNNLDIFQNYELCSKHLLGLGWKSRGDFQESVLSKTKRRLNDLSNYLNLQYGHPQFDSVQAWINFVIKYCDENFSDRFVFSELYNCSDREFFDRINIFIKDIGIPIIQNRNNEFMDLLPSGYKVEQFWQFYVLHQFMNFIYSEESKCPVYDFCCSNANCELDRSQCLDNPLLNLDEEYLCPFKLFIKLYGLDEVEFL